MLAVEQFLKYLTDRPQRQQEVVTNLLCAIEKKHIWDSAEAFASTTYRGETWVCPVPQVLWTSAKLTRQIEDTGFFSPQLNIGLLI